MSTICENCEDRQELQRFEDSLKKIKDEIIIRRLDERTMKLKHPKGFVEGLEWAVKTLEDKK